MLKVPAAPQATAPALALQPALICSIEAFILQLSLLEISDALQAAVRRAWKQDSTNSKVEGKLRARECFDEDEEVRFVVKLEAAKLRLKSHALYTRRRTAANRSPR